LKPGFHKNLRANLKKIIFLLGIGQTWQLPVEVVNPGNSIIS
jgi:hypothetical protein